MRVLPPLPSLPSPASLRARLALWYLLLLAAVLLLFGAAVYLQVRGSLLSGVDAALQTRAEVVASQVHSGPHGPRYLGSTTAEDEPAVYLFGAHVRLRQQITGSTDLPPHPRALAAALHGNEDGGAVTVGGQRLYMLRLEDRRDRVVGVVQVVGSLDTVTAALNALLVLLVLATPALLAVATAGGIFLAGRALAPIDRITRTAQAIGAGNLAGRLGLAPRDDEVGRLAATFDGMLDRLERAFAQQRQFAADASHELRTPLTIIKGDLDVLLRRRRTLDEYEEIAHGVDEEVTHVSRLVEDLLILARADSGQAELAHEFVTLDALVEDVAAGIRRLAASTGIAVETRIERDIAVVGDPARLRQLLLNLLGNAVKYTATGGTVQVTLSRSASWARLDVADTGIGIAAEDLPHVFDRFFRTDKARSRTEGGTGLGLAIARWCAEAHGGRIEAHSTLGEGSVFTVWLPVALIDGGEEQADWPQASSTGTHDHALSGIPQESR